MPLGKWIYFKKRSQTQLPSVSWAVTLKEIAHWRNIFSCEHSDVLKNYCYYPKSFNKGIHKLWKCQFKERGLTHCSVMNQSQNPNNFKSKELVHRKLSGFLFMSEFCSRLGWGRGERGLCLMLPISGYFSITVLKVIVLLVFQWKLEFTDQ